MKKNLGTKMKVFWWKHGWKLLMIGGALGISYGYGRYDQKRENKAKQTAKQEAIDKEIERQKTLERYQKEWEEYRNDPKNQLGECGIVTDNFWDEGIDDEVVPNLIVCEVPMDKLGEFGEEIKKRAADYNDGSLTPDILTSVINENTKCDIVITMHHEEKTANE